MPLIIDLKPREKVIIGHSIITNDSQRTRLHIDGDAPILREKDVLKATDANTPCKYVYYLIQLMYLSNDPTGFYDDYFKAIRDIQRNNPDLATSFTPVNQFVLQGAYYKAMKATKKMIDHEKETLNNDSNTITKHDAQ